jgi:HSP20 family protein
VCECRTVNHIVRIIEEEVAVLVRFERFPIPAVSTGVVEDLFADFLRGSEFFDAGSVPALDLAENDNELVVVAEIPGVKKDDVKVTLDDGILTISGERKQAGLPEGARWHRTERSAGSFSRSLTLPVPVNASAISAELKDGILRIALPKADEAKPREIRVQ